MPRRSSSLLFFFHLEESFLLKIIFWSRERPGRSKRPELGQGVQGEEWRVRKVAQQMHRLDLLCQEERQPLIAALYSHCENGLFFSITCLSDKMKVCVWREAEINYCQQMKHMEASLDVTVVVN